MSLNTTTRTVAEVITEIRRTFGDEASVQVSDDDIIRWINSAQREILIKNKILKAVGTSDVTANVSEYDITGLNIVSIQSIHFKGRKVDYMSFQEAEEYIVNSDPEKTSTGDPIIWYEWGGMLNFYPVPKATEADALKIYYIPEPATVTLNSTLTVPNAYFENVVQYVLARAYELDEDNENSQYKLGQFNERLDALSEQENYQGQQTYPRITVLEEDSWG